MCQNDASSFRYIIIVLPFFIEYDLWAQRKNLRDSLIKHKFDTM